MNPPLDPAPAPAPAPDSAPAPAAARGRAARPVAATLVVLALWGLSWGLSYVDLGAASLVIALVIAGAMGLVVVSVFLEIAALKTSVRLAAATAILMFAILMGLVVIDVVERGIG